MRLVLLDQGGDIRTVVGVGMGQRDDVAPRLRLLGRRAGGVVLQPGVDQNDAAIREGQFE